MGEMSPEVAKALGQGEVEVAKPTPLNRQPVEGVVILRFRGKDVTFEFENIDALSAARLNRAMNLCLREFQREQMRALVEARKEVRQREMREYDPAKRSEIR